MISPISHSSVIDQNRSCYEFVNHVLHKIWEAVKSLFSNPHVSLITHVDWEFSNAAEVIGAEENQRYVYSTLYNNLLGLREGELAGWQRVEEGSELSIYRKLRPNRYSIYGVNYIMYQQLYFSGSEVAIKVRWKDLREYDVCKEITVHRGSPDDTFATIELRTVAINSVGWSSPVDSYRDCIYRINALGRGVIGNVPRGEDQDFIVTTLRRIIQ